MQWDGSKTGGFSAAVPWIEMNPNHTAINAASQIDDPDSVFVAHYQKLIALRKQYDVTANGDFAPLDSGLHPPYCRRNAGRGQQLLPQGNRVGLSGRPDRLPLPAFQL